jgi:hypothetical protein
MSRDRTIVVAEIAFGLTSLQNIANIAKAMMGLRDAEAFRAKSIELQGVVLEAMEKAIQANQAQAAQVEHIRALEAEVARLKEWGAEKERYELKSIGERAKLICSSQTLAAPNHRIGFVQTATPAVRSRFCSQPGSPNSAVISMPVLTVKQSSCLMRILTGFDCSRVWDPDPRPGGHHFTPVGRGSQPARRTRQVPTGAVCKIKGPLG